MNLRIVIFSLLLFIALVSMTIGIGIVSFRQKEKSMLEIGYVPGKIYQEMTELDKVNYLEPDTLFVLRNGITTYAKVDHPDVGIINNFGFRSPDFQTKEKRDSSRLCIGLIGDSYTYGKTAVPYDSSFADRLRAQTGFYVDNLGIQGASLPEYLNAFLWYVPQFRPDLVYIILSDGDLVNYIKENNTNYPFQYGTNAGAFPAYDEIGRFRFHNAFESRDYYVANYTLLKNESLLARWASQTAFGTQLWKKYFWHHLDTLEQGKDLTPKSWWYFDKMDSVCRKFNVIMKVVVIPHRDRPMDRQQFLQKQSEHLRNHDVLLLSQLNKSDYVQGLDSHADNSGHYKIMQALEKNIQEHQQLK